MAAATTRRYGAPVSPLVRACIAAAVLTALASAVDRPKPPVLLTGASPSASGAVALLRPCPPGTLLDNQVCVPAPNLNRSAKPASPRDWQVYDRILRRPERPESYQLYRLPAAADSVRPSPFSVEPGSEDAIFIHTPLGAEVTLASLEGQLGGARVLYTGDLVGQSVVTEHHLEVGRRQQTYLVVLGNLGHVDTRAGVLDLHEGALLGRVGDSAGGHAVGLHVEIRKVREGVDTRELRSDEFRARAKTVACDPRNVLQLKAKPQGHSPH